MGQWGVMLAVHPSVLGLSQRPTTVANQTNSTVAQLSISRGKTFLAQLVFGQVGPLVLLHVQQYSCSHQKAIISSQLLFLLLSFNQHPNVILNFVVYTFYPKYYKTMPPSNLFF